MTGMSICGVMLRPPRFSPVTFFWLAVMLAASTAVFHRLTRRWTWQRRRAAIDDWAAEDRFEVRWADKAALPEALEKLKSLETQVDVSLHRGHDELIAVTTASARWHLLIHRTQSDRMPAALRPSGAGGSIVDMFGLSPFPALLGSDRLVVYAAESRAARMMARSAVGGLLPQDVGLLVSGPFVMLDFSRRPFDAVEFARMLAVMGNLIGHLPEAESPALRAGVKRD